MVKESVVAILKSNEGSFVNINAIQGELLDAGYKVGLLELFQCLADLEQEHRAFNLGKGRYTYVTPVAVVSEAEYKQQLEAIK
jgi:hypothetical protein